MEIRSVISELKHTDRRTFTACLYALLFTLIAVVLQQCILLCLFFIVVRDRLNI